MVILWQDCYGKGNLKKSNCSTVGKRFPIGNVSLCTVKKDYFLSVYVDDIKFAGEKRNIDPMWKLLNKEVDLGEPTSFLDHVYFGCTQRQCETNKKLWTITEPCLNREFPRVGLKNFRTLRFFVFLHRLVIWKVMRSNVWSDIVS